ncbi:amino acid adenylation domain-containing protein [Streptomyces sp. p1417]|uniref:Amino acid adenylation domain-containing protein n=1 Tax=Streptomyces typhae TaxID=2681492 RepID=A0A6L6X3S4_9ACTN|nr:amino acid adenylation domain-containing protein [Streptomyces typhae]MVO88504.1 amino acid adenylation domain-containing protein [Streptomyces typhae]
MPHATGWQRHLVRDFTHSMAAAGLAPSPAGAHDALTRGGWHAACLPADAGGLGLTWYEAAMLAERAGRVLAPTQALDTLLALPALTAAAPRAAAAVLAGTRTPGLVTPAQLRASRVPSGEAAAYRFTAGPPGLVLLPAPDAPAEVACVEVAAGDGVRVATPGDELWQMRAGRPGRRSPEVFRTPAGALWAATALLRNAHLAGVCLAAVETAVDRLRSRRQFGRPLAAQQALVHPLAAHRARLEALRLENDAQLLKLDECAGQPTLGRARHYADVEADAATVGGVLWSLLRECVRHAVHVHGASGLQDGQPVALAHRLVLTETARLGPDARQPAWNTGAPTAKEPALLRGIGRLRTPSPRHLAQRREPALVREARTDAPTGPCAHEMFARAAARHPEAVAVRTATQELTYRQLNADADRLADALGGRGIGRDDVVGLHMGHGADTVTAILGVLKAGAAYLPLDPGYPAERLAFVIQDSRAAAVLTDDRQAASVLTGSGQGAADRTGSGQAGAAPAGTVPVWTAAELLSRAAERPLPARVPGARPDSLAYLIYTSGSTGTPKGVEVEHRGLANRLRWDAAAFPLGPGDAVLQHTSLSFDISVWEVFAPLMSGATLVVAAPGASGDPRRLLRDMRRDQVSVLACVPSLLDLLVAEREPGLADVGGLRYVFCGGETLSPELCRRFHALGLSAQLHNFYGPSECTIDVTSWHCRPQQDDAPVPIGRPLDNVTVHVFDETGALVPPGYPGELYVGGAGVARGYRNRPGLTAERFVADPFSGRPDARLYRTGDLVRMGRDGVVHFLGRSDGQVKVSGHRIELDEIRCTLERHPGVRTAVVQVRQERIEAHVVPVGPPEAAPGIEELVDHARLSLPAYMVPAALATVATLPVTRNGKIDHRALPPLRTPRPAPAGDADAAGAGNAEEQALAALAARVLGLDTLGPGDDFFAAGGSSLHAARFVSRVRSERGLDVRLEQFLAAPTVRELARAASPRAGRGEESA